MKLLYRVVAPTTPSIISTVRAGSRRGAKGAGCALRVRDGTAHQRARSREVRALVCGTSGAGLSLIGNPDISRVALDSRMGNRRDEQDKGSPGTSLSLTRPLSGQIEPSSSALSLDLSDTRAQPFGIGFRSLLRVWFAPSLGLTGTFFDDKMSLTRAN